MLAAIQHFPCSWNKLQDAFSGLLRMRRHTGLLRERWSCLREAKRRHSATAKSAFLYFNITCLSPRPTPRPSVHPLAHASPARPPAFFLADSPVRPSVKTPISSNQQASPLCNRTIWKNESPRTSPCRLLLSHAQGGPIRGPPHVKTPGSPLYPLDHSDMDKVLLTIHIFIRHLPNSRFLSLFAYDGAVSRLRFLYKP